MGIDSGNWATPWNYGLGNKVVDPPSHADSLTMMIDVKDMNVDTQYGKGYACNLI